MEPSLIIEKALQALRDLGGKTTSPALVKKLGLECENARDKVRRLMDELVVQHKVKEIKLEQAMKSAERGSLFTSLQRLRLECYSNPIDHLPH